MSTQTTKWLFCLIFVGAAVSASANAPFKSTMKSWKGDAATMDRLLGASTFDEAEAARILQGFSNDTRTLIARVNGSNAQARDVKARFEKFSADIQSTIDAIGSRDKLKARYAQMRADCRSCHDVYDN